ncbi:MAG: transcription termination/antitermination protein NusG [Mycoplasmataceae bacterium]|jgi:transcriptional antiterminator NusG|nr:transcription termination/antitermination protein NusG [Mycoplasmataceae bacterium]
MKTNFATKPQWFIITVIGGKEKSIITNIVDRLNTYGYYGVDKPVREIKIIEHLETLKKLYNSDDASLPKNLTNTKTTSWKTLPNGKYEKTITHVTNKFPSYIFINMIYDLDIWYVIRNTGGVLGFIGSSGKGAKPTPISLTQYESALVTNISKKESEFNRGYQLNTSVTINSGAFAGEVGLIKANTDDGVKVEVNAFGRKQDIDVKHGEFSLTEEKK